MALQAMWVPGNVAIPEFVGTRGALDTNVQGLVKARFDQSVNNAVTSRPVGSEIDWSDIIGHRGPAGAAFRGQNTKVMLFSFPIPSPVFRSPGNALAPDPNRARLNKIFVMFDSQAGARLNHVFVSDGGRRIFDQQLDGVSGAFGSNITWGANPRQSNVWILPDPMVFFGVTVSVFVQFGPDENTNQIIFRSAGADFLV